MTILEFIQIIKNHLKNNKNKWLIGRYIVDGKLIEIKLFNKYLQILNINGIYYGGLEYKTQKELIQDIENSLND